MNLGVSLKAALEAILFACGEAVGVRRIQRILSQAGWAVSKKEVEESLQQLCKEYTGRGMVIEKIGSSYRMVTRPELGVVIRQLGEERRRQRLSQAALETLAIIAYRQPITRGDIEKVRGVGTGNVVRNLVELELVKIVGKSEPHGAFLYGTTEKFLEVFGLEALSDLPHWEENRKKQREEN